MSSFFAKALTFGALAAPAFAAPTSLVKKSQTISTSADQAAVDLCGTADNLVLTGRVICLPITEAYGAKH